MAAAACDPEASVAKLAGEQGVNTNLLFKWRIAAGLPWISISCSTKRISRAAGMLVDRILPVDGLRGGSSLNMRDLRPKS